MEEKEEGAVLRLDFSVFGDPLKATIKSAIYLTKASGLPKVVINAIVGHLKSYDRRPVMQEAYTVKMAAMEDKRPFKIHIDFDMTSNHLKVRVYSLPHERKHGGVVDVNPSDLYIRIVGGTTNAMREIIRLSIMESKLPYPIKRIISTNIANTAFEGMLSYDQTYSLKDEYGNDYDCRIVFECRPLSITITIDRVEKTELQAA